MMPHNNPQYVKCKGTSNGHFSPSYVKNICNCSSHIIDDRSLLSCRSSFGFRDAVANSTAPHLESSVLANSSQSKPLFFLFERTTRIELAYRAWKARVLPLYYIRKLGSDFNAGALYIFATPNGFPSGGWILTSASSFPAQ